MLDTHCHLDFYGDPSRTALNAETAGVFVVCVTNLPSAFLAAQPYVRQFKKVRLALGLHPLNAELHTDEELSHFKKLVDQTSFIGEIGLDFSREGRDTRSKQLNSFAFALRSLNREPKFITIHSRGAESAVLDLIAQEYPHPVVFHWYSGTLRDLDTAISRGHFFSINPAMVRSPKGRAIVERLPQDKTLTESDGPFVTLGNKQAEPSDVRLVEEALGGMWGIDVQEASEIIANNFREFITPLGRPVGVRKNG